MKKTLAMILTLGLLPAFAPGEAEARPYCREYTKTIRIGGKVETGYGQACLQPDGAWEITKLSGSSSKATNEVRERIYRDLDPVYSRVTVVNRFVPGYYAFPFIIHQPYHAHRPFFVNDRSYYHKNRGHHRGHHRGRD